MEGRAMNKVGGYDAYVNNYQNYAGKSKEQREAKSAGNIGKTGGAANTKPVELSREAKNLLKELQQKYGNMDFIVGDFETEEEAAAYLDRGTKEYSVLVNTEELEKMAKDESVKKENMEKIEDARNQLAYMRTQLQESGDEVKRWVLLSGRTVPPLCLRLSKGRASSRRSGLRRRKKQSARRRTPIPHISPLIIR